MYPYMRLDQFGVSLPRTALHMALSQFASCSVIFAKISSGYVIRLLPRMLVLLTDRQPKLRLPCDLVPYASKNIGCTLTQEKLLRCRNTGLTRSARNETR
jgi:hypothetical protein